MLDSPASPEEIDSILALIERQKERMRKEEKIKREIALTHMAAAKETQRKNEERLSALRAERAAKEIVYDDAMHAKIVALRTGGFERAPVGWDTIAKRFKAKRVWIKACFEDRIKKERNAAGTKNTDTKDSG